MSKTGWLKRTAIQLATLGLAVFVLAGCSSQTKKAAPTKSSSAPRSTITTKAPKDYLPALGKRGLTVNDVQNVNVGALPMQVDAKAAVSFKAAGGTQVVLFQFDTQTAANKAKNYYVNQQHQRGYTERGLLLVTDTSMMQSLYKRYQDGVFQQ